MKIWTFIEDVECDTKQSELNNMITKGKMKQVYNKNNKYDNKKNQTNNHSKKINNITERKC